MSFAKNIVFGNTSWCGYANENDNQLLDKSTNLKYIKIEDDWWGVLDDCPNVLPSTLEPFDSSINSSDIKNSVFQNRILAMYLSKQTDNKIIKVMSF